MASKAPLMKHALGLLGLLAATLVACSDPASCVEVSRPPVTDPDAPLVIGGTFDDVLDTVAGERSGALQWLPSEQYVRGFPSAGEGQITVTIHAPSMVQEIDLEKQGGQRNERLVCPDWVEAELQIDLRTDDGSLDTTVLGLATLNNPSTATIQADLTEEALGALAFDPIDPDATLRLELSYGTADGPVGALVLSSGSSDDGSSGAGMTVDLATWTLE